MFYNLHMNANEASVGKRGAYCISVIHDTKPAIYPNHEFIKIYFVKKKKKNRCDVERSNDMQKKISKSIDRCQPARTAQADMNRYFLQMHYAPIFTEHGSNL